MPGLHRRIRAMIDDAESFIAKLPSDAVGVIFMDGDRPVQPDVGALDKYQRNPGAPRGLLAVLAGNLPRHARTLRQAKALNVSRFLFVVMRRGMSTFGTQSP